MSSTIPVENNDFYMNEHFWTILCEQQGQHSHRIRQSSRRLQPTALRKVVTLVCLTEVHLFMRAFMYNIFKILFKMLPPFQ